MTTYVALLRGINVGGKNLVRMADLADCFRALGNEDVKTYINSGNVIFRSAATDRRELEAKIESAVEKRLAVGVRVLVRDLEQMRAVVQAVDDLFAEGADERQNVIFLADDVDGERILDGIEPKADIESVTSIPGTLLWSAKRSKLTRSEMLKLARREVYQSMTIRNPNTTRRIYELMLEAERPA